MTAPQVFPLGEAAFTIRLGDAASVEAAERAAALADAIRAAAIDGITEVVPAVASVAVFLSAAGGTYDPATISVRVAELASRMHSGDATRHHTVHTVPTRYDGADLDEVAERVGLAREEVVRRHTSREYHVLALGFLPGWAYLGSLDPALSLPRRATPRTRVPAGSVAIMGAQTGVYPRVTPGGWHLIGTTEIALFDPARTPPALFRAGDRVRFRSIE